jgi:hypothetical protein
VIGVGSDPQRVSFVLMLLAPTVMAVASAVERRSGASAAGWVAALPVAFAVAVTGVGLDLGNRAAGAMALSAAGHVSAQIAFAVGFAATLRARGPIVGLLAGAASYAACSVLLADLPPAVAVTAALPALLVGPRLVRPGRVHAPTAPRPRHHGTALACLVAALIVAGVMLASRLAGPVAAGVIGAFPAMSTTLALSLGRLGGKTAAAGALHGLVRSLPCYLTFCLVIAAAAPALGVLPAVGAALAGCLATGRLTWRSVRTRAGRRAP